MWLRWEEGRGARDEGRVEWDEWSGTSRVGQAKGKKPSGTSGWLVPLINSALLCPYLTEGDNFRGNNGIKCLYFMETGYAGAFLCGSSKITPYISAIFAPGDEFFK